MMATICWQSNAVPFPTYRCTHY